MQAMYVYNYVAILSLYLFTHILYMYLLITDSSLITNYLVTFGNHRYYILYESNHHNAGHY